MIARKVKQRKKKLCSRRGCLRRSPMRYSLVQRGISPMWTYSGKSRTEKAQSSRRLTRKKHQTTMKVLQHNLNQCKAAQDLLMQTVRDWNIDVVIITDPCKLLRTNQWVSDASEKAAIWSCGKLLFQDNIDSTRKGFVRTKLHAIGILQCTGGITT